MVRAIEEQVTIQPGGRIEICHPDLPEGANAEVIVMLDETADEPAPVPLPHLFGAARGCFGSPDEIDRYLREERDSWER